MRVCRILLDLWWFFVVVFLFQDAWQDRPSHCSKALIASHSQALMFQVQPHQPSLFQKSTPPTTGRLHRLVFSLESFSTPRPTSPG